MTIYDLIEQLVVENKGDLTLETLKARSKNRAFDFVPADIDLKVAIEFAKYKWQMDSNGLAHKVAHQKLVAKVPDIPTCG